MADAREILIRILLTARDQASAVVERVRDGVGAIDSAHYVLESLKLIEV